MEFAAEPVISTCVVCVRVLKGLEEVPVALTEKIVVGTSMMGAVVIVRLSVGDNVGGREEIFVGHIVGLCDGDVVGEADGIAVGMSDGDVVGWLVGAYVGAGVGIAVVGVAVVGVNEGTDVGYTVGGIVERRPEGAIVGIAVGNDVGAMVRRVGVDVGDTVGVAVGAHVPPANVVGTQSQIVAAGMRMVLLQLEDANASLAQYPLLAVMFGSRKYRKIGVVWNAANPKYCTVSGRSMEVSPSQNANASLLIFVTLSGMLMNCSPSVL